MQTDEYRQFVGRFRFGVLGAVRKWAWPTLISLLVHAVIFWPAVIFQGVGAGAATLHARLQPRAPALRLPVAVGHDKPAVPQTRATASSEHAPLALPSHAIEETAEDAGGPDAGGLRNYRLVLARAIDAAALRNAAQRQTRTVLELGVSLDAFGVVTEVALLRGSGQTELDRLTLEIVRRAAAQARVPFSLKGRAVRVPVSIEIGDAPPILAEDR